MSLFSYAASTYGIALYPTQTQYIEYYVNRNPHDYPNGRNPGNFGCNSTDILGQQSVCGQAGPQSPLPHWSTTDTSDTAVTALNAAFIIGSGIDARVGGCFNLVGEANNRVLPCYCFYTAQKMNRTTSCDWLNPEWYRTDLGQNDNWIVNFNDFKSAMAHLFGIMLVNSWNTFFTAYQSVFGRWAILYFYLFFFFVVIIISSLLVSFVMDAFFLHFKAGSSSASHKPALSKRKRREFELAFSIVCCIEHSKGQSGLLCGQHVVFSHKTDNVYDTLQDIFEEDESEVSLDDPRVFYKDFCAVNHSDAEFEEFSKNVALA